MFKGHRGFYCVALTALAVLIAVGPAAAGDWAGKVETVDGKKVVANPASPIKDATTVEMEELWRLGGFSDNEDEFFGVIADIEIDEAGNVYLLDSQLAEVKIYDKDGNFVNAIGREGEGPGEFRRPSALFFTDNGNVAVVQTIPGKIVILTPEGDPAGEFPIPKPEDGGFQLLIGASAQADNVVLFMARTNFDQEAKKWSRTDYLAKVDEDGNQLAEYARKTKTINMADPVLDDAMWDTFERRWAVATDGKVYACESYDDYEISVWNADGSFDKQITRKYGHRARDADEKEFMDKLMSHFAQTIPNCKVTIHDMCKDIESIAVRDDGSIWVLNSDSAREAGDDALGTFDVYNAQGHFVRNVTLKGDGDPLDDLYLFVKDRVYVVTDFLQAAMVAQGVQGLYDEEEEGEPMAVICYKLDGDDLASR
jgi:hypothetical protein